MSDPLWGKRIILGVSGGIAAYKTPALVRLLKTAGCEVQVVMTEAARHFVTELTLQSVSGRAVRQQLLDPASESGMDHIALARWADAILIAPASADLMARLAQGRANDLLCALVLACPQRPILAPAMNQQMWAHPATQRNLARLLADGVHILGPASGEQACGDIGPGRMLEPEEIAGQLRLLLAPKPLAGRKAVVTAGPTWEAIDPVRGLSNHSSGKQGYAVAQALAEAGAAVTLISGPVSLATPAGVQRLDVQSAQEMLAAVETQLPGDIFVGVAAVADLRPAQAAAQKLAKDALSSALALAENPDILASVAGHRQRPALVIGFAAQTHDLIDLASQKRRQKGADWIIANDAVQAFGADQNHLTLIHQDGATPLGHGDKLSLARLLVAHIHSFLEQRNANR